MSHVHSTACILEYTQWIRTAKSSRQFFVSTVTEVVSFAACAGRERRLNMEFQRSGTVWVTGIIIMAASNYCSRQ